MKKFLSLLLVTVITGCLSYDAIDTRKTEKREEPTIRLATYNIRYRVGVDRGECAWEKRAPRCVRVIQNRGFDIFGVQEATPIQIADLEKGLGPNWGRIGVGREKDLGGEASCIFYKKNRFRVHRQETFWLSETPKVPGSRSWKTACPRVCTWGEFEDLKTGKRFFHFNTHLDHISQEARLQGARMITKRIQEVAQGKTVFLTGDFNAEPSEPPYRHITGILLDSQSHSLTPHQGSIKTYQEYKEAHLTRIDYVFTTRDVIVLTHTTCNDREGAFFPSDHDPVLIEALLK